MATEDPPSKRQRGEEFAVEQEAEEIEPIASLTDLPASVLMRIHELIIGDEAVGGYRQEKGPSKHHSVSAVRWPSPMQFERQGDSSSRPPPPPCRRPSGG
jgi:hypothetical protein